MKLTNTVIASVALATSASALADDPPRGDDIHEIAAHCNIGPFEQTSKAGRYNALCSTMTDAEKCLALIKMSLNYQNELEPASLSEQDKAVFCLEKFQREIIRP